LIDFYYYATKTEDNKSEIGSKQQLGKRAENKTSWKRSQQTDRSIEAPRKLAQHKISATINRPLRRRGPSSGDRRGSSSSSDKGILFRFEIGRRAGGDSLAPLFPFPTLVAET